MAILWVNSAAAWSQLVCLSSGLRLLVHQSVPYGKLGKQVLRDIAVGDFQSVANWMLRCNASDRSNLQHQHGTL